MTSINYDNLPKHLRKYVRNKKIENSLEAKIFFIDKLDEYQEDVAWVRVAECSNSQSNGIQTDIFFFSSIVKGNNIDSLLDNPDWDVNCTSGFGRPKIDWENGYFEPFTVDVEGYEFKPFTIFREFPDTSEPVDFELLQEFILFHNGVKKENGSIYVKYENGQILDIVKIEKSINESGFRKFNIIIQVEKKSLLEFLAAYESSLVIYEDSRRYRTNSKFNHDKFEERELSTIPGLRYVLDLRKNSKDQDDFFSRFEGKRVIHPPKDPKSVFNKSKIFAEFIYGIDDDGNYLEFTCQEGTHSNNFQKKKDIHGKEIPHSLTPIFFKIQVIDKYQENSELYHVHEKGISIEGSSGLSFDKLDDNIIVAYLKDISYLPYHEQNHWRSFNIPPLDTVPEEMITRDQLLKPPMFAGPVDEFKKTLLKLQELFSENYEEKLFLNLNTKDKFHWKKLLIPTSEDQHKIDAFILSIAKITADSLNVKVLNNLIKDIPKKGGSITLLKQLLTEIGASEAEIKISTSWMYDIQELRSSGSAHRKGRTYIKSLKKKKIDQISNIAVCSKLVNDAINGLNSLISILKKIG